MVQGARAAERLSGHWRALVADWCPDTEESSIWRSSRADEALPAQGWKVHLSATVLSAPSLLETAGPVLREQGVHFKAVTSLAELSKLNSGLFYGYSQIGKAITAYPATEASSGRLMQALHQVLGDLDCPGVTSDRRLCPSRPIFYRYGGYDHQTVEVQGVELPAVRDPEGNLVVDARLPGGAVPSWSEDPFTGLCEVHPPTTSRSEELSATYKVYASITQRGKGGVFRALDLSVAPARLCILKEGRRAGEVDWLGRDGRWRVEHEHAVLQALRGSGVKGPEPYAAFRVDGNAYLAMEHLEGLRLDTVVNDRDRPDELGTALSFAVEAAGIMARIHEAGWVWRDCKPMNFVVTDDGLRPLDFESACRQGEAEPTPWVSPGYWPAQQAVSWDRPDVRDDLYCLGSTLWHVFSGRLPGAETPPRLDTLRDDLPDLVVTLVDRLVGPDTDHRPEAAAVARDLASLSV